MRARGADVSGAVEPVVLVHGGAGRIDPDRHDASLAGVEAAARRARTILLDGGTCEEAVVAAVRELEERPDFNAGRGSVPNREGGLEMDAAVMRSRDLAAGAVAAVPDVLDPVAIAWRVLEASPHCLLVGEGAVRFAQDQGVGTFGREHVWTPYAEELFRKHLAPDAGRVAAPSAKDRDAADTVGALALDRDGNLAAAGSTGGVLGKAPGRVGDTPLVGAGLYAHPYLGAACATGTGEALIRLVASYAILASIAAGRDPEDAAADLCREAMTRWRAPVGLLVLRPDGTAAVAHGSEHMSWALARGTAEVEAGLTRRGRA